MPPSHQRRHGVQQQPSHSVTNTLKATLSNPDSALYATVCRYHSSDAGNLCLFGDKCRYLHLAHLDRPRVCDAASQHLSDATQKVQYELDKLKKTMTAIQKLLQDRLLLQPAQDDGDVKNSSEILLRTPVRNQTARQHSSTTPIALSRSVKAPAAATKKARSRTARGATSTIRGHSADSGDFKRLPVDKFQPKQGQKQSATKPTRAAPSPSSKAVLDCFARHTDDTDDEALMEEVD